jgi:hypothetical protein
MGEPKMVRLIRTAFFFGLLTAGPASALPLLEQAYPLPASFDGVITIYPDSDNTPTVHRYWLVPNTARIKRKDHSTDLELGFSHGGLTRMETFGIKALLSVTIQPYVDDQTLQSAKKLITDADAKTGASSSFNYIGPTSTTAYIMVGGHPGDFFGDSAKQTIAGGSVDAGIPFQVLLSDEFDVRTITQRGGDKASLVGARFKMAFDGLTDKCSFTITAHFDQVYEHFKQQVAASGWFGLVGGNEAVEWQNLKSQPWVKFTQKACSDETLDRYYGREVLKSFLDQLTSKTGYFAPQLKPNGLPNAPGSPGIFGWSLSVGGGYEQTSETVDLSYSVDVQSRVSREIEFGMSFVVASDELKPYIKNISDTNKPIPTSDDIAAVAAQHEACSIKRQALLDQLYSKGAITQQFYQQQSALVFKNGCVKSPTDPSAALAQALNFESGAAMLAADWKGSRPFKLQDVEMAYKFAVAP